MTFQTYISHASLAEKPATCVRVEFWHHKLPKPVPWPALLDTGSPFTILPGRCSSGAAAAGQRVRIELLHCEEHLDASQRIIYLPVRGREARIGPPGFPARPHLPFIACLEVPGFTGLDWETVYFMKIDHAIIGTPILFRKYGMCFRETCYRAGRCPLRPAEFFRKPKGRIIP